MSWQFVLCESDSPGIPIGEVTNASDRHVTIPHMRIPTASFKIPAIHDLATPLLTKFETVLKCYRTDPVTHNKQLVFNGPVTSIEEIGESGAQSISVTASGPLWRLAKRIIPGSLRHQGVSYGPSDLGNVAIAILQDCNTKGYLFDAETSDFTAFTGIAPGTVTAATSGSAGTYFAKNAAEAITELAAAAAGFEFEIAPTEPTPITISGHAMNQPQIAYLNTGPTIGQTRADVIFEYGTTYPNVLSYSHQISRDGLLTRGYMPPSGWPDGDARDPSGLPLGNVNTYTNIPSGATFNAYEEVLDNPGITDTALLNQLLDFVVDVRCNPRRIITFTPAPMTEPYPFQQYGVGDFVRARALIGTSLRFDGTFRVWGFDFTIDDNGAEQLAVELVEP